jgi:Zn ribbon nucleic-acid-binding protein
MPKAEGHHHMDCISELKRKLSAYEGTSIMKAVEASPLVQHIVSELTARGYEILESDADLVADFTVNGEGRKHFLTGQRKDDVACGIIMAAKLIEQFEYEIGAVVNASRVMHKAALELGKACEADGVPWAEVPIRPPACMGAMQPATITSRWILIEGESCPECGDDAEIKIYDHDNAEYRDGTDPRCSECGHKGTLAVNEDGSYYVDWEDA